MRILLIEDHSATAQSIELMLKSESFNVYTTDLLHVQAAQEVCERFEWQERHRDRLGPRLFVTRAQ
jgi:DNA-binding response OmpR family regulator